MVYTCTTFLPALFALVAKLPPSEVCVSAVRELAGPVIFLVGVVWDSRTKTPLLIQCSVLLSLILKLRPFLFIPDGLLSQLTPKKVEQVYYGEKLKFGQFAFHSPLCLVCLVHEFY